MNVTNCIVPLPPIAMVALVTALIDDEEEEGKKIEQERLEFIALQTLQAKRALDKEEDCLPKGKRTYIKYDRDRARVAVENDYFGPIPLHLQQHGVDGMLGSLDCMHVGWKNCPVAWQGAFQGKEKAPTIVLEAVADYNLKDC
jgi:Plant transposon protein